MFGEVPPMVNRMLENANAPQDEIPIVTVISITGMLGPNSLEELKSYIDAAFKPRYCVVDICTLSLRFYLLEEPEGSLLGHRFARWVSPRKQDDFLLH